MTKIIILDSEYYFIITVWSLTCIILGLILGLNLALRAISK
jgi:hypothetical protein